MIIANAKEYGKKILFLPSWFIYFFWDKLPSEPNNRIHSFIYNLPIRPFTILVFLALAFQAWLVHITSWNFESFGLFNLETLSLIVQSYLHQVRSIWSKKMVQVKEVVKQRNSFFVLLFVTLLTRNFSDYGHLHLLKKLILLDKFLPQGPQSSGFFDWDFYIILTGVY